MNTSRTLLATLFLALPSALARAADFDIRLNTLGFLPTAPKHATIAAKAATFTLLRADTHAVVLTGTATGPKTNEDTAEELYTADFSALQTPGQYILKIEGIGQSLPFKIAPDLYNQPFYLATRAMYLWRCGSAVSADYHDRHFAHEACHLEDAYLDIITGQHTKLPSPGGWHDAGDYNKYVVNAGVTVGMMFKAWEHFAPALKTLRLDIPESGNGTPDILNEARWELTWLLTMQAADGSVYHKLSTKNFGPFIPPEKEKTDRFFAPWSSAATADFAAMTAAAGRHYAPYDKPFAEKCLAAARKSYAFLAVNPANHDADLKDFKTGGYGTTDPDDRLWAAAELWETTGEDAFLQDLESALRADTKGFDLDIGWGNVKNLGFLTYLQSQRPGRNPALRQKLQDSLLATADRIVKTAASHGYARPYGTTYYWGANGAVASQTLILQSANLLKPNPDYVSTSADALASLLGRNPYARSFITGLGNNPPLHPHDRRGSVDGEPWPGYLIGGGHPKATDWHDLQGDFKTNEIAINWNGALIYALAGFVTPPPPAPK